MASPQCPSSNHLHQLREQVPLQRMQGEVHQRLPRLPPLPSWPPRHRHRAAPLLVGHLPGLPQLVGPLRLLPATPQGTTPPPTPVSQIT
jgi:hypothetical protein